MSSSRPAQGDFGADEIQYVTSRSFATRDASLESAATLGREDSQPLSLFERDEVIDLTAYESDIACPGLLQDGEHPLDSVQLSSGAVIRSEECVQVRPFHIGTYEVEFVLIKIIARDHGGQRKIRGIPLARTRKLLGKLFKKINEVVMILHIQRLGNVAAEPHLVDIPPSSIVKTRRLIITNATYKYQSYSPWPIFKHIENQELRRRKTERNGHLVCRWKLKVYFTPQFTSQGRTGKPNETALERIHGTEVLNAEFRVPEDTLCNRWRGGKIRGGSWRPNDEAVHDSVELNHRPGSTTSRSFGQKYTLIDTFSGAGGVSRGAQSAGFWVQGAVDRAPEVWDTYRMNFRNAELFQMSIHEFIAATTQIHMRADVLHLSPPCQYFSPAHTHASVNDDANIDALFSCHALIDKVRPRVVTLEQTFGIIHDRHSVYLRGLISEFTNQGYSIRWKIVRLCTWGLAQDRKRLIMIAAGPGERLPPFPDPTHSENGTGGQKRFATLRQAISGLRRGDDMHDIANTKHFYPPRPRINADRLTTTITTGGSEAYYPDGTRDFTLREYACLQGFPKSHRFSGTKTSIKRQIGNAFPPNTVQVLYQHLHNWLMSEDGMAAYTPPSDAEIVNVDADDEDESDVRMRRQSSSTAGDSPEMVEVIETGVRNASRGAENFIDLT